MGGVPEESDARHSGLELLRKYQAAKQNVPKGQVPSLLITSYPANLPKEVSQILLWKDDPKQSPDQPDQPDQPGKPDQEEREEEATFNEAERIWRDSGARDSETQKEKKR